MKRKTPKTLPASDAKEFDAAGVEFKARFGNAMLPYFRDVLKAGSVALRTLPKLNSITQHRGK